MRGPTDSECGEIRDRLSDYLDGRTGDEAPERAWIAAHLERCELCREYLADIEGISTAFRDTGDEPVPVEGIVAGAMERIGVEVNSPSPRSARARPLRAIAGFAAALAAAAAVWVAVVILLPEPVPAAGGPVAVTTIDRREPPALAVAAVPGGEAWADLALECAIQRVSDDKESEALLGFSPRPISFDDESSLRTVRSRTGDDIILTSGR